ncbi:CSLREA domain-containing protein [Nocardia sp. NPDC004168]|uniref:CSLREA domain-containing protein n=1 Tax=Nocardia sp. NPDC004168 TaxID=3154452 RepID=UPI0033A95996
MRTRTSAAAAGAAAITALAVGTAGGFPGTAHADGAPGGDTPVVITVDTAADETAAGPGSGLCRMASGTCTLRAAVQVANARPGSTIVVLVGRYVLAIPPDPQKVQGRNADPTTGDLNLTAPTVRNSAIRANISGIASANCATAFARFVSEGGDTSDDASWELTGAGYRVVS